MNTTDATASQEVLEVLEATRVIAIMRGDFRGLEEEIVTTLAEAGVAAVEVTLNSPGALDAIRRVAALRGERLVIGAGTVLDVAGVERACEAGARFIISPNRDRRVIEAAKRLGLMSLPGCFTPSEIVEALAAGADAVKLFPARSLGSGFVRDVLAPLGRVRIVPTGGVTPESASEYIAAGAWAVGVGSELVGPYVLAPRGLELLRSRAAEFVRAVEDQAMGEREEQHVSG